MLGTVTSANYCTQTGGRIQKVEPPILDPNTPMLYGVWAHYHVVVATNMYNSSFVAIRPMQAARAWYQRQKPRVTRPTQSFSGVVEKLKAR